jgi:hypothetical protein
MTRAQQHGRAGALCSPPDSSCCHCNTACRCARSMLYERWLLRFIRCPSWGWDLSLTLRSVSANACIAMRRPRPVCRMYRLPCCMANRGCLRQNGTHIQAEHACWNKCYFKYSWVQLLLPRIALLEQGASRAAVICIISLHVAVACCYLYGCSRHLFINIRCLQATVFYARRVESGSCLQRAAWRMRILRTASCFNKFRSLPREAVAASMCIRKCCLSPGRRCRLGKILLAPVHGSGSRTGRHHAASLRSNRMRF